MHPVFRQLFIQADADDLLAEEDRRRCVSRARRARPAMIIRPAAPTDSTSRGRDRRPACCAARWRTCPYRLLVAAAAIGCAEAERGKDVITSGGENVTTSRPRT